MKKLQLTIWAMAALLFMAGELSAAAYIKFDGVDGECRDKAHEKWIDVLSVDYAVVQPRDAATGLASGKRQHKPIKITKRIDKTTPLLMQIAGDNGTNPNVTIELTRIDPDSQRDEIYFKITMKDVVIVSYNIRDDDDPDSPPIEEVTLIFNSIEWLYMPEKIMYEDSWKGDS